MLKSIRVECRTFVTGAAIRQAVGTALCLPDAGRTLTAWGRGYNELGQPWQRPTPTAPIFVHVDWPADGTPK